MPTTPAFNAVANPSTLPASTGNGVDFAPNNTQLFSSILAEKQ